MILNKIFIGLKWYFKKTFQLFDHKHKYLLKHDDFTIISNNCIAGFLYKEFGTEYKSPTIGLQFPQRDFVKFCKSFSYYIHKSVKEKENSAQEEFSKLGGGKIEFPVGKIEDITIFFQHYSDIDTAVLKWNDRVKRINMNNLYFIFLAYDSTPEDVLHEFDSIDSPNKLILTNSFRFKSSNVFALNNGEKPWFDIHTIWGSKYYHKYDYKSWFYNGALETEQPLAKSWWV